jgi:hypothetical protein
MVSGQDLFSTLRIKQYGWLNVIVVDVVHGGDASSSGKSNSSPLIADEVGICLR